MATYFDSSKGPHLELLPEGMRRSQDEISRLAPQVERDVIRFYTRRASQYSTLGFPTVAEVVNVDLGLVVFLLGYKVDADDADTDVDLKIALRDTIADVIVWRIRRGAKDPAIREESSQRGKSVEYDEHRSSDFPPNWNYRLANFNGVEPPWAM